MMRDRPVVCDAMRDVMRDRLKARETAIWTNAPLVRSARAAGGKRPDGQDPRILALGQEVEPSESNAADKGVREPVHRLLACRRYPSSGAQDGPPLTFSPASFPRAPPLLFPVSPNGSFFGNSSSFDFLFARLALTLGSRPQQSRLGQTGRQSPAERSALQRQSSQ
jgi:hypothetical protein